MGRISMPMGKGSLMHNRRDYQKYGMDLPDNILQQNMQYNVTLVDMDIREAYDAIFGAALADYNRKQKRNDRKIDDYYEHIKKSKNGEKLFYEDVVQWGSEHDFTAFSNNAQIAKSALMEYVEGFEDRNPNLKLIGAYIHMDECSPHLHLDYIPVAHGYKKGMSVRNSLDKAMKEMGWGIDLKKSSKKINSTMLWKKNEREVFRQICLSKGLEVEAEREARGSLTCEEYREAKERMINELTKEIKEVSRENDHLMNENIKLIERSNLLSKQCSKKEEELATLNTNVSVARKTLEKTENETRKIEEKMAEKKLEFEKEKNSIENSIKNSSKLVQKLEKTRQKLDLEIEKNEKKIEEQKRQMSFIETQFKRLKEQIENLKNFIYHVFDRSGYRLSEQDLDDIADGHSLDENFEL